MSKESSYDIQGNQKDSFHIQTIVCLWAIFLDIYRIQYFDRDIGVKNFDIGIGGVS